MGRMFCGECGHELASPATHPSLQELSFEEKIDKIQRYLPDGLTEKILTLRGKIEGERKQVTVMFCDMEGYTALSYSLGPEKVYYLAPRLSWQHPHCCGKKDLSEHWYFTCNSSLQ